MDEERVLYDFVAQARQPVTIDGDTANSRTKQSHKDECDVNNIVRKHASTGLLNHVTRREPLYGDFTGVISLQDSLENVAAAQAEFDALPSAIRAAANNDPLEFARMVAHPEGAAALEEAGLVFGGGEILDQAEAANAQPQPEVPAAEPEGESPA